jgi:hypothetical protein
MENILTWNKSNSFINRIFGGKSKFKEGTLELFPQYSEAPACSKILFKKISLVNVSFPKQSYDCNQDYSTIFLKLSFQAAEILF